MNILMYTFLYPTPAHIKLRRADTTIIQQQAEAWSAMGHRVQVIHIHYWPLKKIFHHRLAGIFPMEMDYEVHGIPVHLLNFQTLIPRRTYPHRFQAWIMNRKLLTFQKKLGWKPDKITIDFPTIFTGLDAMLTPGVPAIGICHHTDVAFLEERFHPEMDAFMNRIPLLAGRNPHICNYLTQRYGRKAFGYYIPIQEKYLAPAGLIDEKIERKPSPFRILYAGQLIPLKHVDTLIEAAKLLDFDYELEIIGDGSEAQRLKHLAKDNPKIRFKGWQPREKIIEAMRAADIFIMVSSPETYGLVYLEAMAQGCVTVGSRGEGFDGLLVDGENGFLAAPGNAVEAAKVLNRIARMDKQKKAKILHNAYTFADSMSIEKLGQRYLDAIR